MMKSPRIISIATLSSVLVSCVLGIGWSTVCSPARAATPTSPQTPVAVLRPVGVPANPADRNAIKAPFKILTDAAKGETQVTVAMGTTGTTNHPINVPFYMIVQAVDPKNTGKPSWTLTKPVGSKTEIKTQDGFNAMFTPDVVGAYKVDVVLRNDAGVSSNLASLTVNAGTYIGLNSGNCAECHPVKTQEWAKTGHGKIFTDCVDNLRTREIPTHYSEACIRCHMTGWFAPPYGIGSGGFVDAKAKANWTFPTFKQIDDAGKKTGPSNWDTMPAFAKNMANVQCEACHGPANEHVKKGAKVMASSFDNAVCNGCHAGGGHHIKGYEITFSKHSDEKSSTWTYASGPSRQVCVRCHSGKGFVSFLANPAHPAAWDNQPQTIGCSVCHEPHSEENAFQLRIVGKPVEMPFAAKDVGLSATCYECHNNRTRPGDAAKGEFPHYSSEAEMLSNAGGITYGQSVPNSPHGGMVGAAPIPNPAAAKDPEAAKFLFTKPEDGHEKGNLPGPCVGCHMWPGLDAKSPNFMKVGEHSFNMVAANGKFNYGAPCKECHGEVKDFNLKAKADYDGDGKVEGVKDEVRGLLDILWKALEGRGVQKLNAGFPYAKLPQNADDKIKNALYNYRYVYGVMWGEGGPGNQGSAAAIHNFNRSVALLQLSYRDLTGQDVPNAALMKK
jgi:hypothetical protein